MAFLNNEFHLQENEQVGRIHFHMEYGFERNFVLAKILFLYNTFETVMTGHLRGCGGVDLHYLLTSASSA